MLSRPESHGEQYAMRFQDQSVVSRRLDRDPSQSMHAQREGEFTSMMQIVLNEMPDHPLACIGLIFSMLIGIVNKFCQISSFLTDYHKKR